MPQRTNEFQRIVTLIQEAAYPSGAKVTESHMVPGLTPGKFREIDILVETKLGPCNMKIAVEAKDEGRRFDVTAMEEIVGKYRGRNNISVDKVVVVTHRGFTLEAEALAKAERIETMTLADAEAEQWTKRFTCPVHGLPPWAGENQSFRLLVTRPIVELLTFSPPLLTGEENQAAAVQGQIVCHCHGHEKGTLLMSAYNFIETQVIPNQELMAKLREVAAGTGQGKSAATFTLPIAGYSLRFAGKDHPIEKVTIRIRYIDATGPLSVKRMILKDDSGNESYVQYAEAEVAGKSIQFLLPIGQGFERSVLKVHDGEVDPDPAFFARPGYDRPIWQFRDGQWVQLVAGQMVTPPGTAEAADSSATSQAPANTPEL